MSGVGFRLIQRPEKGAGRQIDVYYFAKRKSGADVEGTDLIAILASLADDSMRETIEDAFAKLRALAVAAFEKGLKAAELEFLFQLDLFEGWHFQVVGLDRDRRLTFKTTNKFREHLEEVYHIPPLPKGAESGAL